MPKVTRPLQVTDNSFKLERENHCYIQHPERFDMDEFEIDLYEKINEDEPKFEFSIGNNTNDREDGNFASFDLSYAEARQLVDWLAPKLY